MDVLLFTHHLPHCNQSHPAKIQTCWCPYLLKPSEAPHCLQNKSEFLPMVFILQLFPSIPVSPSVTVHPTSRSRDLTSPFAAPRTPCYSVLNTGLGGSDWIHTYPLTPSWLANSYLFLSLTQVSPLWSFFPPCTGTITASCNTLLIRFLSPWIIAVFTKGKTVSIFS